MLSSRGWESEPWATAKVFYFAPDKTDLILDAVKPLLQRLEEQVPRSYFVRHWHLGPHLRLRFSVDPATFDASVRPLIEEVLGSYLAERPSTAVIDEASLLRQHQRLARLESEPGPLTPFASDNTIRYESASQLGHDAEDDVIQRLLADFYVETETLAYSTLEALRAGRTSRYDLAFDLMVAVAHALYPSPRDPTITEGFVSFRSHAEAYLAMVPRRGAVRSHFERQYQRFAPVLIRRVHELTSRLNDGPTGVPELDGFLRIARPHIERARTLVAAGRLVLPVPRRAATGKPGWDDTWVGYSPFHTLINESDRYLTLLFETMWFQQYRMALNLMYLHLNRLGLLPVERYLVCHLVANAVEDCFRVSALRLAADFAVQETR